MQVISESSRTTQHMRNQIDVLAAKVGAQLQTVHMNQYIAL